MNIYSLLNFIIIKNWNFFLKIRNKYNIITKFTFWNFKDQKQKMEK
jgi:hypothetical protein